jgi:hypothetical protein
MFRPLARSLRRPPRKGTSFTLIAVSMLTLFAAVGMGYALFGHTANKMATRNAEAQGQGGAPAVEAPEPTNTMNRFLGSLIFDVPYDRTATEPNALTNALRGHSFARSMYGYDLAALNAGRPILTPFAGVGTFHEQLPLPNGTTVDRGLQVNYTLQRIGGNPFLLDPEYTGVRAVTGGNPVPGFDPNATGRNYVNKAAGYSYADNKDFFLAVVDPVTGQVLVPSFFRYSSLQGNTLAPNSAFWGTEANKLTMLRPWPNDHPQFPRVPQNADVSYTGDVQNLPGGVGTQRNDSFWMDIGAPVFTWNGKRIKPLVAPLIVPLNGLLNASAHGRGTLTGVPNQPSPNGFGPWDVNLAAVLAADGAAVVNARGTPQQRNTNNQRAFAPVPNNPLPSYSPVAWRGAPALAPAYTRGGDDLIGEPNFNGLETDNNPVANHPSLFNPNQWPSGGGTANRSFATTDANRLFGRYAFMRQFYQDGDLTALATNDLRGTQAFNVAPTQTQAHAWRIDPAHANRLLVTPFGYDLHRPKVAPQHLGGALALAAGSFKPTNPEHGRPYPPAGSTPGPGSDFAAANRWTNALAALGGVDLNRHLADYRVRTGEALSAANFDASGSADADREALARDVFVRLIAATGGAATIDTTNGTYTVNAAPGTPEYNALRYLAQVAANVVDYIDNDDVSTVFVWDPNVATERVFGVEKPRLLISEAYSEIANDPTDPPNGPGNGMGGNDPPNGPAHARFWVELLNPSNLPAPAPANSILGDGSVPLSAYRIEISRFNRQTGVPAAQRGDVGGPLVDAANAGYAANATGSFDTALGQPDLKFALGGYATTAVEPNRGQYAPGANLPANGFLLVGPEVPPKNGSDEFAPAAAGVWQNAIFSPYRGARAMDPQPRAAGDAASNSMAYTLPLQAGAFNGTEFKRNVVLLRRLANPYLPEGPNNPFVTVDMMDLVPSFDAVNRFQGGGLNRSSRGMMMANMNGFDPVGDRFSVGKVQPFAGFAAAAVANGNAAFNQYGAFPRSMIQAQTAANGNQPKHTFGRHNGSGNAPPAGTTLAAGPALSDTIMAPFDWYVHMDRTLVNATELLHVRDSAAHHVTSRFLRPNATFDALDYEQGVGAWRASAGLARALEFLTVRPYTVGVPHGGRDPGRINPNAVQDRRVLTAQFDPQPGNLFNSMLAPNFMNTNVWAQWMGTRSGGVATSTAAFGGTPFDTVNARPAQSVYDANTNAPGANRPFFSVGAPAVAAGSTFAFGAGGSENDTILRRDANPLPLLFNTAAGTGPAGGYFQAEPVRKTFNTTTTVNHQYAVFFTIGYFDVTSEAAPTGWPTGVPYAQLGAETYLSVPGDLRQKFVSVVDMSAMALDATANQPASVTPFFTTLETTARPPGSGNARLELNVSRSDTTAVYIPADGTEVAVRVGTNLVVGYGADTQIVRVENLLGGGTIEVSGLTRTAWGGSCVSNVRPGYVGPQSGFNTSAARFRPVVPYVERLK